MKQFYDTIYEQKKQMEISVVNRPSASAQLEGWCYFAKPDDEMEICEWGNGEGLDVTITRDGEQTKVQITWGEWELLTKLVKALQQ